VPKSKAEIAAYARAWRAKNIHKVRAASRLRDKKPIRIEKKKEYSRTHAARTLARQELAAGRPKPKECEVCGGGGRICFDHCHQRGHFRGWLCHHCNAILGITNDDAERLLKLAAYLRRTVVNQSPQLSLHGV
jgi:phage/plasmid primase-like uncharacterized protein